MIIRRIALLAVVLPPTALAATVPAPPAQPAAELQLEFHPIVRGTPKRGEGGGKAFLPRSEYLPTEARLQLHTHADGTNSYECADTHGTGSAAANDGEQR